MQEQPSDNNRLRTFVLIAVTVTWVITVIVTLYTHDYQPLMIVSGLMGAVVGYVTGIRIAVRKGNSEL